MADDVRISGDAAIVYCLVCNIYEVMEGETIRESWANAGQTVNGHFKAVKHSIDLSNYRKVEELKGMGLSLGTLQRENSR